MDAHQIVPTHEHHRHRKRKKDKKGKIPSVETLSVVVCNIGTVLVLMSLFLPRWRVDPIGTDFLEQWWFFTGFNERCYGLLMVTGVHSQSWSTLSRTACDFRDFSVVSTFFQVGASAVVGNIEGCSGSEQCATGYMDHMNLRCTRYSTMRQISIATLCFTFLTVTCGLAASLVACLADRREHGGCSCGLFIVGSIIGLVANGMWTLITSQGFTALGENAWYPYPPLALAWFMHIYGCAMMLVGGGVYGWMVIPEAIAYDPEEERLNHLREKRARMARMMRLGSWRGRPQQEQQQPSGGGGGGGGHWEHQQIHLRQVPTLHTGAPQRYGQCQQQCAPASGQSSYWPAAPVSSQGTPGLHTQGGPGLQPQPYGHAQAIGHGCHAQTSPGPAGTCYTPGPASSGWDSGCDPASSGWGSQGGAAPALTISVAAGPMPPQGQGPVPLPEWQPLPPRPE